MTERAGHLLVTGGSRGIGAALCRTAATRGWDVSFTWISGEAPAKEVVRDIEAAGRRAQAIRADVADEAELVAAFDRAEAMAPIGAVVVNAGITGRIMPFADMTGERLREVVGINVLGALYTAREAARRLSEGGTLTFVSSAAARIGSPGEYVDYAASKGAVDTLVLGLSKELGPKGFRVNGVRPGPIHTDIHAAGGEPGRAERMGRIVPLGRAGQPQEVAEAILWLMSPAASFTNGALLDVAGGR